MRDAVPPSPGTGARVDLAADGGVSVRGRPQDKVGDVARIARTLWRLTHLTVPATAAPTPGSIGFAAALEVTGGGGDV